MVVNLIKMQDISSNHMIDNMNKENQTKRNSYTKSELNL